MRDHDPLPVRGETITARMISEDSNIIEHVRAGHHQLSPALFAAIGEMWERLGDWTFDAETQREVPCIKMDEWLQGQRLMERHKDLEKEPDAVSVKETK